MFIFDLINLNKVVNIIVQFLKLLLFLNLQTGGKLGCIIPAGHLNYISNRCSRNLCSVGPTLKRYYRSSPLLTL